MGWVFKRVRARVGCVLRVWERAEAEQRPVPGTNPGPGALRASVSGGAEAAGRGRTVEEALPDGFLGRVGAPGAVFGGWIQQPLALGHPAVGCYVTHGGYGSVLEGIAGGCQLVMVPFESNQIFNARLIASRLGAGVEVERSDDDGSFTREGVCRAIRAVSGDEDGDGREIRENYAKLRELLLGKGLDSSYVDEFCRKLQALAANLATP